MTDSTLRILKDEMHEYTIRCLIKLLTNIILYSWFPQKWKREGHSLRRRTVRTRDYTYIYADKALREASLPFSGFPIEKEKRCLNFEAKQSAYAVLLSEQFLALTLKFFNLSSSKNEPSSSRTTNATTTMTRIAPFRARKLDLGCFVNVHVLRDHTKRKVFAQHEAERSAPRAPLNSSAITFKADNHGRQSLRYIAQNTSLPQRMRAQAQLQLSQMHMYTRSTVIKNRCIMGGRGKGIFGDFRMSRVCRNAIVEAGSADSIGTVSISIARPRRQHSWCQEGKLVDEITTR